MNGIVMMPSPVEKGRVMAGQPEQKRRAAAVERAVKRARSTAFREILELTEHDDMDLIKGYCQAELGMTKPLEQVRRELGIKREQVH